jgi:hypothetical protein
VTEPPSLSSSVTTTASPQGNSLPVNIPEAVALRNRRAIAKALRPLMIKVPSRQRYYLDEEATINRIAETHLPSPPGQAQPNPWF